MTRTIDGYIENGKVFTPEPPPVYNGKLRCLVTVLDESLDDVAEQAEAAMPASKQQRVTELLDAHGEGQLGAEQLQELDALLAEAHELDLRKAEARRILRELGPREGGQTAP